MKGPLDYGTAACCDIPCPAAGKTGTTESQADAWFVGYTPHVSTAVWVGNPDSRQPMPGYGADLAAPIWQDYMEVAAAQPCDDFPQPQNPADLSALLQRAHLASSSARRARLDGTDTTTTDRPTTPTTGTGAATTATTRTSTRPGAGQGAAPTARAAAARRRRPPNGSRPSAAARLWTGEFELIAAIRERIAAAGAPERRRRWSSAAATTPRSRCRDGRRGHHASTRWSRASTSGCRRSRSRQVGPQGARGRRSPTWPRWARRPARPTSSSASPTTAPEAELPRARRRRWPRSPPSTAWRSPGATSPGRRR